LPDGPVGTAYRWAATSNVEVGQTTYSVNRDGGERRERGTVTKRRRGRREWNVRGVRALSYGARAVLK